MVSYKIISGHETLMSGELETEYNSVSEYLGELKQLADCALFRGIEVVFELHFPNAQKPIIKHYTVGE
jgi:hypothetical protein